MDDLEALQSQWTPAAASAAPSADAGSGAAAGGVGAPAVTASGGGRLQVRQPPTHAP